MPEILVVFHSIGGNTAKAAEAVVEGINDVEDVDVEMKKALMLMQRIYLIVTVLPLVLPIIFPI